MDISSRLTPLYDGRPGLRSTLSVTAAAPPSDPSIQQSTNPAILDFVSSDASLDRYGEIISPAGWKLDTYLRNPVFQNSHQYGDVMFTLGKALITEVRDSKLVQRVQFAVDANPMARIAYNLYRGKFLNAVSVGFIPVRWENGTDQTTFRRKYVEQELLEVSAVGIPANPNALSLAYKSGAVAKSEIQNTIDLLRQTITPAPPTDPALSFLRRLHAIMKS